MPTAQLLKLLLRQGEIRVVRVAGLQVGDRRPGVQVLTQVDESNAQPSVERGAHDLAIDLRLQRRRIGGRRSQRALGVVELRLGHGVSLKSERARLAETRARLAWACSEASSARSTRLSSSTKTCPRCTVCPDWNLIAVTTPAASLLTVTPRAGEMVPTEKSLFSQVSCFAFLGSHHLGRRPRRAAA
jgi:hypothetical protein